MNRSLSHRLSAAAHASLPHANPLSAPQMAELAEILAARAPREVLEIGCGPGTFSIALALACPASVTALDINEDCLARARKSAAAANLAGSVSFANLDAAAAPLGRYDGVVCIGASQAFGAPAEAVRRCSALLRPGGTLVFAELAWSAEPSAEFLSFLGSPRSLYWTEDAEEEPFVAAGLAVTRALRASKASWRAYESEIARARLAFAETLPSDEAEEVRRRARSWMEAYERHGRLCFGFVAYVAEKPGQPAL